MFIVYVIRSTSSGKIYIGYTSDIEKRVKQHNLELPHRSKSYTYKNKGPWRIIYKEEYNTRIEAVKREKQLKSSKGRDYIKKLLNKVP
ncbi:MAG: hypothetical protein A3B10_02430 [Candidatus Doudnabacteria bacterium RIFCSPLOWO2_01_FULL_44_21]|uniref:GIY-YIG domain-containing protein n=1 Tax=Candidatus Doudnabacteria bacterium RIFCSPLOWO2_01_FULL_44_21 TaxID=1817841 RepID=A0A1F5PX84_9BACT|nr:MAG: hypothetical protein A3B10_02430 [Candidatus Doudnabacteria bacterium RIFCSPLOWO2_01_FULL_44_21]